MPYPVPATREEMIRQGFRVGVSVEVASNPTITQSTVLPGRGNGEPGTLAPGTVSGTWTAGTLGNIVWNAAQTRWEATVTLTGGQVLTGVDMVAVRLP